MKAKVTITRRSNIKGIGQIYITIGDGLSGNRVVSVKMEMAEFTECLTGLSMADAEYEFVPTHYTVDTIGKNRIIKIALCDRVAPMLGKEAQSLVVVADYQTNHEKNGWILKDKGLSSQQHGDKHHYTLMKFVSEDEV